MFFFAVNRFDKLKVVKAGEAGKVLPLHKNVDKDWWESLNLTEEECAYYRKEDKDIFVVMGESMAPEYVHTGDLLFVSLQNSAESLKKGELIVLKIDNDRCRRGQQDWDCDLGFKLRMYLLTINMNDSYDDILKQLMSVDEEAKYSDDSKKVFQDKFSQAFREIKNKENVIVSVTYTEKGRMYSFHEVKDLFAKVDKVYKKVGTGYENNLKFTERKI